MYSVSHLSFWLGARLSDFFFLRCALLTVVLENVYEGVSEVPVRVVHLRSLFSKRMARVK